jgi:cytochrome c-type biogenesis protein CcmH/NrfG
LLICWLLALATVLVYGRVAGFDFTNYDDPNFVYENPIVRAGLTAQGVWWGLTTSYFDFWHPLTWWSHMLDAELFGLRPGLHHLVSLAIHVANTLLLFSVMRRMTGSMWRCALVAALFALHPMHVESVAWLAERKDVLAAFFFMLTVWAYVKYVTGGEWQGQRSDGKESSPSPQPSPSAPDWPSGEGAPQLGLRRSFSALPSSFFFLLSLVFFALGLMSKAMVVTAPFVLLLLDFWPLGRWRDSASELVVQSSKFKVQSSKFGPLVIEKIPFFALAGISSWITYAGMKVAQQNPYSASATPWGLRIENAAVAYVRYLGKLIWPSDLAVVYPLPQHWPVWEVAGAVLVLSLISVAAFLGRKSAPYFIVGWLMFLGMLVPVIGLVAMSYAALADRYTYLPAIGIFVAVVWGLGSSRRREETPHSAFRTPHLNEPPHVVSYASGIVLAAYGVIAWNQVGHWRNSLALWTHCVAVTRANPVAHYNLAHVYKDMGRNAGAETQYRAAIEAKPDYVEPYVNLGALKVESGRSKEATNYFATALRLNPRHELAQRNMAAALVELGDAAGAIEHATEALRLDSSDAVAIAILARAASMQGNSEEAVRLYNESLNLNPGFVEARFYLGLEWLKLGKFDAAVMSLEAAARMAPNRADILEQLEIARKRKSGSTTDGH